MQTTHDGLPAAKRCVLCCALLPSSSLWLTTRTLCWGYLLTMWCKKLLRSFIDRSEIQVSSVMISQPGQASEGCMAGRWGRSEQPELTVDVRTLTALCTHRVWGRRGGGRWYTGRCALRKGESKVILRDVTSEQRTLLRLNSAVRCTPAVCSQV